VSLFAAWVVFPLILAALCSGLGLLVDVGVGRRLSGALVPPMGLATMIVIGEFTTWSPGLAQFTLPVLVLLAVLGAGLSLPWRFGRLDPWAAGVAIAVFAVFGAPVLLSGSPTFAGFIKLDDTATWLAMTDRVMEHGRSLGGLDPSSYYATLKFNLAGGYPIGAFIPLGAGQKLAGGDSAWVFQPYLSFLAAMLSLGLWQIVAGPLRRPLPRALAVFLAAQPALLFGYAMWGGVKELAAAALLALAAALAPTAVRRGSALLDVLPLALAAAAIVAVLSPGGLIWLGPMLLALAILALLRFGWRRGLLRAAGFAAALALLSVPVLTSGIVPPTSKPLVGSSGEGNLRGPLSPFQALGIWPSGDFRFHPDAGVLTAVLLALAALALLLGLWSMWRRRLFAPLLYASALLSCALIVILGSPWAAGKALATASPVALSLALLGALAALRLDRLSGGVLVSVLAAGVLWSNVLAYGGVSLAPYGQLVELEGIGKRFAGEGPALMTEYNPYGARHFLRRLDGEGASELRVRQVPLRGGRTAAKGEAVDTDQIQIEALLEYRTLVLRRSPVRSRPPWPFQLVFSGDYYEVWQRPPEAPAGPVPIFLPLGEALRPAAVPRCATVLAIARRAGAEEGRRARLLAARHAPLYDATDGTLDVPRAGVYGAWLLGSVRGADQLLVDGREVGSVRHELNDEGGFVHLGEVHLGPGAHRAELRFGGADLHPGSGGFPRPPTGPLLFAPAGEEAGSVVSVPLSRARRLCGRAWDWVEAP
jgi:hypothetical protein